MTSQNNYACISENSDYVGVRNVPISFVRGHGYGTLQCTTITIREDAVVEYNETFTVILTENSPQLMIPNGRNYTLLTILEDSDCKSCMEAKDCHLPQDYNITEHNTHLNVE